MFRARLLLPCPLPGFAQGRCSWVLGICSESVPPSIRRALPKTAMGEPRDCLYIPLVCRWYRQGVMIVAQTLTKQGVSQILRSFQQIWYLNYKWHAVGIQFFLILLEHPIEYMQSEHTNLLGHFGDILASPVSVGVLPPLPLRTSMAPRTIDVQAPGDLSRFRRQAKSRARREEGRGV